VLELVKRAAVRARLEAQQCQENPERC